MPEPGCHLHPLSAVRPKMAQQTPHFGEISAVRSQKQYFILRMHKSAKQITTVPLSSDGYSLFMH
jgi:hypothetical protein